MSVFSNTTKISIILHPIQYMSLRICKQFVDILSIECVITNHKVVSK